MLTQPEEALNILKDAMERIRDPANWTKGALARDKKGTPVAPRNPKACQWCAWGSIYKSMGFVRIDTEMLAKRAMETNALYFYKSSMSGVNDNNEHSDIMFLFGKAIDELKALCPNICANPLTK